MLSDEIKNIKNELEYLEVSLNQNELLNQVNYFLYKILPFAKMSNDRGLINLTYQKLFELMKMEIRIKRQSLILDYAKRENGELKNYLQNEILMEISNRFEDDLLNENISIQTAANDSKMAIEKNTTIIKYLSKYPSLRDKIISYGWFLSLLAVIVGVGKLSYDNNQLYYTEESIYSTADDSYNQEDPCYLKLNNDGETVKIIEYTHFIKNRNAYERKKYVYDASDIKLDKIEDYVNLDLFELPVEEYVEYAKNLNANDFYNESIIKVDMIKQDLDNHITDNDRVRNNILLAICLHINATIICSLEFCKEEMLHDKIKKLKYGYKKKKIEELVLELEDLLMIIKTSCELNPDYKRYIDDFSIKNDCFEETIDISKKTLKM